MSAEKVSESVLKFWPQAWGLK